MTHNVKRRDGGSASVRDVRGSPSAGEGSTAAVHGHADRLRATAPAHNSGDLYDDRDDHRDDDPYEHLYDDRDDHGGGDLYDDRDDHGDSDPDYDSSHGRVLAAQRTTAARHDVPAVARGLTGKPSASALSEKRCA